MVRALLRLSMKAARISNHQAQSDTEKLKTSALEPIRLDLQNRFEDLQLDEGVPHRTNGESSTMWLQTLPSHI